MKKVFLSLAFILVIALLIILLLRGCGGKDIEMPWGVWQEIRTQARQSPDHLPARLSELSQESSAEDAFLFVRDNFTTVPAQGIPGYRFGVRGMLRTGQGTPFEKSLLLQQILREKGIESEIHWGRAAPPEGDSSAYPVTHAFQVPGNDLRDVLDDHDILPWSRAERMEQGIFSPAWKDTLFQFIKANHRIRYRDINSQQATYPVYARIDSTWVYLNPAFSNAVWGDHHVEGDPTIYRFQPDRLGDPVVIRVKASYDDKSYSPFTLAEARWPLDSLTGRNVLVSFRVIGPPDIILNATPGDFEAFVPTIEVLDPAYPDSMRITGDVITTGGNVVSKEAGMNLLDTDVPQDKGDASSAASISLRPPKMADYPTVVVEAEVKDAEGNPIMGLTEEDMEFVVNGEKVTHRMVVNQTIPPRVMFLYDDSGSMPGPYQSRKRTLEVFREIARACQEVNPDTEFALSPFGNDQSKIHDLSPWSDDISALSAYLLSTRSGESNNWSALQGAMDVREANMVILITDADGTETGGEYANLKIGEGVPAFILGATSSKTIPGEFESMAEKTGGKHYIMEDDLPEAVADISRLVGETENNRYLIELDLENQDIPLMDLGMSVPAADLIEELMKIEVPPPSSRSPLGKNAITGLYLEVEYHSVIYTKKLAGVPLGKNEKTYPITRELIDACNNALWGEYILHFEGSPPLPGVVLDQVASHYLELSQLTDLIEEDDPDRFFAGLQELSWRPELAGFWSLVMDNQNGVYENNLDVWLYSEYPDASGTFWQQIDRFPSHDAWIPAVEEPARIDEQLERGLLAAERAGMNVGADRTVGASFRQGLVNPGGGLYLRRYEGPWQEAFYPLTMNRGQVVIIAGEDESGTAFTFTGSTAALNALTVDGHLARRQTGETLDPDQPLSDHPSLWKKSLGMEMETWDDLEGNKLAYIQVGTVAMKNLGEGKDPAELMRQIKQHLLALMTSEMQHEQRYFISADEQWLNLYNIARDNLSWFRDNYLPAQP